MADEDTVGTDDKAVAGTPLDGSDFDGDALIHFRQERRGAGSVPVLSHSASSTAR